MGRECDALLLVIMCTFAHELLRIITSSTRAFNTHTHTQRRAFANARYSLLIYCVLSWDDETPQRRTKQVHKNARTHTHSRAHPNTNHKVFRQEIDGSFGLRITHSDWFRVHRRRNARESRQSAHTHSRIDRRCTSACTRSQIVQITIINCSVCVRVRAI